ncbi:DUF2779 domain-containing protein [Clostridia bacterium]|nr:DUF2779 domain-containing protein [Clostridia bacterium]
MIDEKLFGKGLFCPRCFYKEAKTRQAADGFHSADIEALLNAYYEGLHKLDRAQIEDWISVSVKQFQNAKTFRHGLFRWQDCYVHMDVCFSQTKNKRSSICLVESKRVKKQVFWELAYQKFVLAKLGLTLDRSYVLYFNKHYRLQGKINPHELLILADVTEELEEYLPQIEDQIHRMKRILSGPEPVLSLEPYQEKDVACSLQSDCYHFSKDHAATVHGISPGKLVKFEKAGYHKVEDIPDHLLSAKARIQKQSLLKNRVYLEKKGILRRLREIQAPISALDFEAFSPMIPQFEGDGVHLPIVYQCSVAYEKQGAVLSESYVYEEKGDPRDGVMDALLRLIPKEGSILVYNQSFERARLKELELRYPEHKIFLKSMQMRLVDLLPLFSSFLVYHPEQQGSTKLKSVARAFLPGSYEDSSVRDGKMAQDLYDKYRKEPTKELQKEIVRDLIVYGKWDARVLVELYQILKTLVEMD